MEIKCFCPHCGKSFTVDIDVPEAAPKKRNMSEEERRKRAERMREMRLQGIGGRPKGSKNKGPRPDKGVPRKTDTEQEENV